MSLMIHRHKVKKRMGAVKKTAPVSKPVAEETEKPVAEEQPDDKKYTKSEINRSSTERLKEIATEVGIEDAESKTGGELKKLIIEELGL